MWQDKQQTTAQRPTLPLSGTYSADDAGQWGHQTSDPLLKGAMTFTVLWTAFWLVMIVAGVAPVAAGAFVWLLLELVAFGVPVWVRFHTVSSLLKERRELHALELKLREATMAALREPGGAGGTQEYKDAPDGKAVLKSWVKMLLFVAKRAETTPRAPRGGDDNPPMPYAGPGGETITLDFELYRFLCAVWQAIEYQEQDEHGKPVPGSAPIPVMMGGARGNSRENYRLNVGYAQAVEALRVARLNGRLVEIIEQVREAHGGKVPL